MPQVTLAALASALISAIGQALVTAAIGLAVQTAISAIAGGKPKPQRRRLQDRTQTVRQAVAPRQIVLGQSMVGGPIIYMKSTGNNEFLHIVVPLADHEIESVDGLFFGNEEVPLDGNGDATGKYAGHVRMLTRTGAPNQTAFSELVTESGGEWTANDVIEGCAAAYLRLKFSADLFPAGLPPIRFLVSGAKVYDPRVSGHDPDDSTTWAYSDNAALCLAYYLNDDRYGMGAAYGAEILEAELIAAANVCDEAVSLSDGGSESRYTINGVVITDDVPQDVLQDLVNAMAGKAVTIGGTTWNIQAGAFQTPTITLDEDDLRGGIRIQPMLSRQENFNAVRGTFVDPDRDHQPTDFPPVTSAAFQAEDNGEQVFRDVIYPLTNSGAMAQRLAKIALYRVRQPISISYPTGISGWRLQAGDNVMITSARFGFAAKVFEVMETNLVMSDEGDGGLILGVDLVLRETAASVYSWTLDDEQGIDPAPNTTLPNPFSVANPTALNISTTDVAIDTVTLKQPTLTWVSPADRFVVSGGSIEVQWKPSAETGYRSLGQVAGDITVATLPPVQNGTDIDVRLRSINSLGVTAASFAELTNYTIGAAAEGDDAEDWGAVAGANDTTEDWGSVAGANDTTEDWGSVA